MSLEATPPHPTAPLGPNKHDMAVETPRVKSAFSENKTLSNATQPWLSRLIYKSGQAHSATWFGSTSKIGHA